ncbi:MULTISPECIES: AI-2E family transporter [Arthrobacter]|uniref:AI-2E family transporter n=2 Tax=Arthrobacter TaxID=1663 RepID=A0ABU9KND6_9MICC|nr:AI-2E family transporter [Arthrobacter sp. YJM1]MDP5227398.1 AI-2E family transporter [Arthrobacter sp. YJM1]
MSGTAKNGTSVEPRPTRGRMLDEDIPYGVRVAAEWAWRVGIILITGGVLIWLLSKVSFLLIPLLLAALFTALLNPVVAWLSRRRLPRGIAVAITMLGLIAVVVLTLIFVGRQATAGFKELWGQALEGVKQVQQWLQDGPLQITTDQLDKYLSQLTGSLQNQSSAILTGALSVGSGAGHIAAGLLLTLFILIFFLLEGRQIWAFLTKLAPRKARPALDGAGRKAWTSVGSYVRIQVFVAAVDAIGIGAGAAIIGVPLALPLGLAVFLGSFIPVVGALVTGAVAVLLALVANGLVNAVIMLAIVLVVQQLESHVLQPLVMGKAVSLHPVGVILAVAAGSFLAGIPGALFAVPVLAALNSAIRFIAARGWETDVVPATPELPLADGETETQEEQPINSKEAISDDH